METLNHLMVQIGPSVVFNTTVFPISDKEKRPQFVLAVANRVVKAMAMYEDAQPLKYAEPLVQDFAMRVLCEGLNLVDQGLIRWEVEGPFMWEYFLRSLHGALIYRATDGKSVGFSPEEIPEIAQQGFGALFDAACSFFRDEEEKEGMSDLQLEQLKFLEHIILSEGFLQTQDFYEKPVIRLDTQKVIMKVYARVRELVGEEIADSSYKELVSY